MTRTETQTSTDGVPTKGRARRWWGTAWRLIPGLALCAAAVAVSFVIAHFLPTVSVLLIAIILGVVLRNVTPLPTVIEPGIAFSAKRLLRLGVVLLGLQLVVGDILDLGAGMILVVIAIVTIGILGTVLIGAWMGISTTQRILIACGFSICGASAVAAVDGVIETKDDEEVVTAIALVVIFGTIMIPVIPLLASLLHLGTEHGGLWAGGSIHEVAQVVAAGGIIGGSALGVAVIVKLARVLMLAPVMTVLSIQRRRQLRREGVGDGDIHVKKPPIMPLFVAGFIVMVALRSIGIVPAVVLDIGGFAQTALLGAAMFALGTGVRISAFKRVGVKPFALATCSTLLVASTALGGVVLLA